MKEKKVKQELMVERIKNVKSVVVQEKCKACEAQLIVHGWNTVTNMKICDNSRCRLYHSIPQGTGIIKLDRSQVDLDATLNRHSKYRREEVEIALLVVRLNNGVFPYHDKEYDRIVNHKVKQDNLNTDRMLDKAAVSELKKMLSAADEETVELTELIKTTARSRQHDN